MSDPLVGSGSTINFDFENGYGTVKGTPTPKTISVVSEKLDGTRKQIQSPSIRPDGNRADPALGNISASGGLEHVLNVDTSAFFAKAFCGNIATTGVGPYTHVSKWDLTLAASPFPSLNSNVQFNSSNHKKTTGMRLKKFSLKTSSEGFLQVSLDGAAKNTVMAATSLYGATSPTDLTGSLEFDASEITSILLDTVEQVGSCYFRSIEIDPQAKLQEDDYRVGGSGLRGGLAVGASDLAVKFDMAFEGDTQSALLASTTPHALVIVWTSGTATFTVNVPRFFIETTTPSVENDMGVFTTFNARASKDATAVSQLVLTSVNSRAGTFYA